MRPIEFRAWIDNFWAKPALPCMCKVINLNMGILIDGKSKYHIKFEDSTCGQYETFLNPEKLMQFTGLLDKNRKKIFEGDILFNPDCNGRHEVKWMDMHEGVGLGIDCSSPIKFEFCEVIGNIYENPELIEANKEQTKDFDPSVFWEG